MFGSRSQGGGLGNGEFLLRGSRFRLNSFGRGCIRRRTVCGTPLFTGSRFRRGGSSRVHGRKSQHQRCKQSEVHDPIAAPVSRENYHVTSKCDTSPCYNERCRATNLE